MCGREEAVGHSLHNDRPVNLMVNINMAEREEPVSPNQEDMYRQIAMRLREIGDQIDNDLMAEVPPDKPQNELWKLLTSNPVLAACSVAGVAAVGVALIKKS